MLAMLAAGCAAPTGPATIVESSPSFHATDARASTDPGWILMGKVVTMNDADEVLPGARIWLKNGAIAAIVKAGDALPPGAEAATTIDTGGAIYPGLIDTHNHPEYAIYPLLPIARKYRDRYEWRFYDDDYTRRITNLQTLITSQNYLNLYPEVGRYGELKALIGGTTSIQGMRSDQLYSVEGCLARNIETSKLGVAKVSSRIDIGRDMKDWKIIQDAFAAGPLVVHLAEGTGFRMAQEYQAIKNSDLAGKNLVVIHGVGLGATDFEDMKMNGAKLVWSPLSNFMLYGTTTDIDTARTRPVPVPVSLAPDWAPSGSKSILGELKVADLVNKNRLKDKISDRELAAMVTRIPASSIGWGDQLGQLKPKYLADLLVLDDRHADPYRNLIEAIEENVRLVWVQGIPLYGDARLMQSLRDAADIEDAGLFANSRPKMLAVNCPSLPRTNLTTLKQLLQTVLNADANYVAKNLSPKQIAADLAPCKMTPSDPPTAEDARRMLKCRFDLPFEKTILSPFATSEDPNFFSRLLANPNLPAYLKNLPDYYRK